MLRITFIVAAVFAMASSANCQTPKLESETASDAIAEYLRAVETARRECIAKLEVAHQDATKNGKREEAGKIQEAKAAIDAHRAADVFHPFSSFEEKIGGTKWANADNARLWTAFDKDHTLRNVKGEAGKWAVVSENTVASTTGVKYVYLWVFDEDGRSCTLQRFNHDTKHARPYVKQ